MQVAQIKNQTEKKRAQTIFGCATCRLKIGHIDGPRSSDLSIATTGTGICNWNSFSERIGAMHQHLYLVTSPSPPELSEYDIAIANSLVFEKGRDLTIVNGQLFS